MNVVTLSFGPNGKEWVFMFREKDRAEQVFLNIEAAKSSQANGAGAVCVRIDDDFGQKFSGDARQIHGHAFEDLDRKHDANAELHIAQIRGSLRLQQRIESDPDPEVRKAVARARQQNIIARPGGMPNMGPMPMAG